MLAPPARRPPLRKRPAVVAAGSALLGFVTGAVFWHSIGFWSFVSTVVLKGPEDEITSPVRETQTAARVPVHLRPTGSIGPVRPTVGGKSGAAKSYLTCSLAVADDIGGEANVVPCPVGTIAAPTKPLARKGDLLTVGHAAAPAPAAPSLPPATPAATTQAWTPTIRGPQR